ncbi:MAG: HAD hydrolase family protein [Ignavibacteria bacterium]|nr:HAD hydrolase family protein [Ignavibacteria bacterium]
MLKPELIEKLKKIKIFLTDVDGVLTDGGMHYTENGLYVKRFHVRDGMGSVLLTKAGLKTGLISSDRSPIAKMRGQVLNFQHIYTGTWSKTEALAEICEIESIAKENVAFIGDDVNDLDILREVGFSACPADAIEDVKNTVHYICKTNGGFGAYREIADLILTFSDYKL